MAFTESETDVLARVADEFVARHRRGERPSIEEYEQQYPEHAEAIRDLFPALVVIEQLKPSKSRSESNERLGTTPRLDSLERLGDYRIVCEIGRGGMGVVYEAIQESLGRRVALKVLPRQHSHNDSHQARFEREARAAARLHHSNIVPVFAVGHENDLHFYAMQYIHGQGLDEVLRELRRQRLQHESSTRRSTSAEKTLAEKTLGVAADRTADSSPTNPSEASRERTKLETSIALTRVLCSGITGTETFSSRLEGNDAESTATANAVAREYASTFKMLDSPEVLNRDSATTGSLSSINEPCLEVHRERYCESIARIGVQVAEALHYAHEQGILHRDIKPANLLLDTRGTIWVTDFGLAKTEDEQDLTQTGNVLGTLRYLAPECLLGNADRRSDVYALGVTLFELLTLRSAFEDTDRARLIHRITNDPAPRMRSIDPSIPRDLDTIIGKAIDRDPALRYPTAQELAADLDRFLRDEQILARRESVASYLTRWFRKNRLVASLASVALTLLLLVIAILTYGRVHVGKQRDQYRSALFSSLVTESKFRRIGGESGQRAESLRKLTQAARMQLSESLRDEVIECLTLHDLDPVARWPASFPSYAPDSVTFDSTLAHYVCYGEHSVEIRQVSGSDGKPGPIVQSLPWPEIVPRVAKFSRDGEWLVVRAGDGDHSELRVWKWREGVQRLSVKGVAERAFDIDTAGARMVCGLIDGTIQSWNLSHTEVTATWQLPSTPFDLQFQPQGSLVACVLPESSRVQIHDSRDGKLVHDLDMREDIYCVAWHPRRPWLAIGLGFDVAVKDLSQPDYPIEIWGRHLWMIHAVQFHPSGDFLVTHSLREGNTKLWDVRARRELLVTPGHFIKFSESGERLASVHNTELSLSQFLGEQEYQTYADLFSPDTDVWRVIQHPVHPLIIECGRHGIRCWDPQQRRLLAESQRQMVYTICVDSRTGDLLTAGEHGLQRWPLRIEQGLTSVAIGDPQSLPMVDGAIAAPTSPAFSLVCSRDGLTRVASFRGEPYLYLQEMSSGRVRRLPCDPMTAFVAISPDGNWIAAGNYQSPGFHIWRTSDQDQGDPASPRLLSASGSAAQVVFSPDSKYLIACANDRYLWFEVGSWELRQEILRTTLVEGSAAFSSDGRLLALTMGPRDVQLREVASGKVLANLKGGRDPVNILNLQFHPRRDDQLYLACGPYGIRLWDLAKVRETLGELGLDW